MTAQSTTSSVYIFIIYIYSESISFSLLWIRSWIPILMRHSNNPTFGKSDILWLTIITIINAMIVCLFKITVLWENIKLIKIFEPYNDILSGTFLHYTLYISLINVRLKVHAQMYLVPRNQIICLTWES